MRVERNPNLAQTRRRQRAVTFVLFTAAASAALSFISPFAVPSPARNEVVTPVPRAPLITPHK